MIYNSIRSYIHHTYLYYYSYCMFIFYKNVHDDVQLVVTDACASLRLSFSLTLNIWVHVHVPQLAIFNFYMSMAKMSCSCGEEKAVG